MFRPRSQRPTAARAGVPGIEYACQLDADGRVRQASAATERALGQGAEPLRGTRLAGAAHPDDQAAVAAALGWVAEGGAPIQFEGRWRHRDGAWRWVEWQAVRPRGEMLTSLTGRDVTRWRQDEALASGQARVLEAVAQRQPLPQVLAILCETLETLTDCRAAVFVPDADGARLHLAGAPSLDERFRREVAELPLPDGPGAAVVAAARREPVVVPDVLTGGQWTGRPELPALLGIRAEWAQPALGSGGELLAVVACYLPLPRGPRPPERQALALAAHLASVAIGRERAEADVRLLTRALGHAGDIVLVTEGTPGAPTTGRRILYVNEAFERRTGYRRDEVMGRTLRILQGPQTARATLERIRQALDAGRPVREEVLNYARDGRPFWLELDLEPMRGPSGALTHWVATGRDVTARKLAELALAQREAHLERALEAARVGTWEWDAFSDTFTCSASLGPLLGLAPGEGFPSWEAFLAAVHPDDRAALEAVRRDRGPGHDALAAAWRMTVAGGERWLAARAQVERAADGDAVRVTGTVSDVTEARRADLAARATGELLQALFHASPVPIVGLDTEDRVIGWNAAAERALGWSEEEVLGHPFPAVPDDQREAEDARRARERAGEAVAALEVRWRHRAGAVRGYELSSAPIRDAAGDVRGTILALVDVSERRRQETERLRLGDRVQQVQRLESLAGLAGGLAHEFNNLLTGILSHAGLARLDVPAAGPAAAALHEIEQQAQRAAGLVTQLLAYSGRGALSTRPTDLSGLIEGMGHLLQTAVSRKATLHFRLAPALPPVLADAGQLRQVVLNLASNASDALGEGAGTISIATSVVEADRAYLAGMFLDEGLPAGRYVALEVSDTGAGMDDATVARVFDPFFSTKFAGRGLGLAAVLGIVRAHRGAIRIYSKPGVGTTVRILLPAAEAAAAVPPAPPAPAVPLDQWRAAGTVLVVDDDDTVRSAASRILERCGFDVLAARDGLEAVELFRQRNGEVRLVLLDLAMPRMDGAETLAELLRIRPEVRVVLTSGYDAIDATSHLDASRLAGFVAKPFAPTELVAAIRGALPA